MCYPHTHNIRSSHIGTCILTALYRIIFRSPISRSALLGELVEPGSGGLTSEELELYTYMESDTPALAQLITANKSIVALG